MVQCCNLHENFAEARGTRDDARSRRSAHSCDLVAAMGLLSQLSALLILAAVTVAYLHATQPETVAPLLQRIRTWLLAKLEWDLATIMPELAPPPEPEPYAAPAFVDKRKGSKKATKKPPPKTQPAATNKKPHEGERDSADGVPVELRLDPSDGNYYPKESFVEVYGGTREWTLQEGTSRFSDATEPAAGDAAEGWTVVPSPSSKLAVTTRSKSKHIPSVCLSLSLPVSLCVCVCVCVCVCDCVCVCVCVCLVWLSARVYVLHNDLFLGAGTCGWGRWRFVVER